MRMTRTTMAMPAAVTALDAHASADDLGRVFHLFDEVDQKFSVFRDESPVSKYRRGERTRDSFDEEERHVWDLCEQTKRETDGYFDAFYGGTYDPTGLVKGYAIRRGAELLRSLGYRQFLIEIAGDGEAGEKSHDTGWKVGISNPFNTREIVKVVQLSNCGIATSGIAEHLDHIVDPHTHQPAHELASITVIAQDAEEADRFATAAFSMGTAGLAFVEQHTHCAAYAVTADRRGVATTRFKSYEVASNL